MIEDVYEPLKEYRDSFREKFAEFAREKFRELCEKSGVDIEANRKLVAEIKDLESEESAESRKYTLFLTLCILCFVSVFCCGIYAYNQSAQSSEQIISILLGVSLFAFGVITAMKCSELRKLIDNLKLQIKRKIENAYEQMRPLNELYTWDIPVKLIEQTVPRLAFDPYFTLERLVDLKRLFGWDDSFNEDKSILFAQSGVINGNPFVFGEFLEMSWGEKTYTGYKTISWRVRERDANGKWCTVTKTQTLSASVVKPIPEYSKDKILIYGNDAAPNLSFSRAPSSLSNAGDGFFANFKKRRVLKELQKFSENLDDDSDYTLMANHEFETLFYAKNRDNEVEFRLLFTALAQEQMLQLMKDDQIGYGDDFSFAKCGKINALRSEHLSAFSLSTDPQNFYDWDFDRAHLNFKNFNENYFKNLYFSLAPLLSIPLYQQTRTYEDIYKDVISTPSSFWEHEAIANYYGDEYFRHSSCVTQNILKTEVVSEDGEFTKIRVTANGFRGVTRHEHIPVWGGDGRSHNVTVEWIEYLPVEKNSYMYVSESPELSEDFLRASPILRRSVYAHL